ncbi:aspartate carbamoyltransferase [Bordetella sp. H567]|nr:aspartate carbamoyltransferase [Bordetella sp. H567]
MESSRMDHAAHMEAAADAQHQAEVSRRGKEVMPFSLPATTHIFTKNAEGGVQRVVAKDASDDGVVKLIRQHLQEIRQQFLKGDFSAPSHIHGQDMPGLLELTKAEPGQLEIAYQDVEGGAQLVYKTKEPTLVAALHKWFDAQLSDHGQDAIEEHQAH